MLGDSCSRVELLLEKTGSQILLSISSRTHFTTVSKSAPATHSKLTSLECTCDVFFWPITSAAVEYAAEFVSDGTSDETMPLAFDKSMVTADDSELVSSGPSCELVIAIVEEVLQSTAFVTTKLFVIVTFPELSDKGKLEAGAFCPSRSNTGCKAEAISLILSGFKDIKEAFSSIVFGLSVNGVIKFGDCRNECCTGDVWLIKEGTKRSNGVPGKLLARSPMLGVPRDEELVEHDKVGLGNKGGGGGGGGNFASSCCSSSESPKCKNSYNKN